MPFEAQSPMLNIVRPMVWLLGLVTVAYYSKDFILGTDSLDNTDYNTEMKETINFSSNDTMDTM